MWALRYEEQYDWVEGWGTTRTILRPGREGVEYTPETVEARARPSTHYRYPRPGGDTIPP